MSAMSEMEAAAGARADPWRRPDLRRRRPELVLVKSRAVPKAEPVRRGQSAPKRQSAPTGQPVPTGRPASAPTAMPTARAMPATPAAPPLVARGPGVSRDRAAADRPATGAESARLRLTRRGRVVVGSVLAIAAAAAASVVVLTAAAGAQAADHAQGGGGYAGMREVVVRPGQTLWSIAAAAEPSADPRVVVQQIMTVNSLTSTQIQVGQLLWVPR